MSSVNDSTREVSPHYQGEYQHWDWAADNDLGYFEAAATKYICRAGKKRGEDARQAYFKAATYLDKLEEAMLAGKVAPRHFEVANIPSLVAVYELDHVMAAVCQAAAARHTVGSVRQAAQQCRARAAG